MLNCDQSSVDLSSFEFENFTLNNIDPQKQKRTANVKKKKKQ